MGSRRTLRDVLNTVGYRLIVADVTHEKECEESVKEEVRSQGETCKRQGCELPSRSSTSYYFFTSPHMSLFMSTPTPAHVCKYNRLRIEFFHAVYQVDGLPCELQQAYNT